jgi:hypothetical protein
MESAVSGAKARSAEPTSHLITGMISSNSPHLRLAFLFASLVSVGCRPAPQTETKPRQVGWRPIISFSGRGNTQTESFNIESTQWRIKWQAKQDASADPGSFQVMVHSAVSGRPIAEAVPPRGAGSGIAYVTEDPRLYHLVIESKDVDWSMAVEEAVVGEAPPPR